MKKLLADTIVDILSCAKSDSEIKPMPVKFKRGFFLKKPFICSRTTLKSKRVLITENFLLQELKSGSKNVKIPTGAILTPMARMLIEEGKVKVDGFI